MHTHPIILLISLCLLMLSAEATPKYFCTAANAPYYIRLLNLIGSLHKTNFNNLKEIAVFDLGLTQQQRTHLNSMQKVTVYDLDLRHHKDLLYKPPRGVIGWYAWKYVAMKQCLKKYPYILWIDAGTTVLKPLDHLFDYIATHGYFLTTIGDCAIGGKPAHPVSSCTTQFVIDAFNLSAPENKWILEHRCVMGGLQGSSRSGSHAYLDHMYELAKDLTYFQDDGTAPGGFGNARHDQPLLSAIAYTKKLTVFEQDGEHKIPITLGPNAPLFITWNPRRLNKNTHIYNSRGKMPNLEQYKKCIKYKHYRNT